MRAGRTRSMALLTAVLVPLLVIGPAWGDPSDYYTEQVTYCLVDPSPEAEIDELSGLVSMPDGDLLVVEDDTAGTPDSSVVHLLRREELGCAEEGSIKFPYAPADIEDIALLKGTHWDPDTVWLADIGDNGQVREEIALITAPYDPSERPVEPKVFRFSYPDGPHDAEALVLPPNGTPYIVTKEVDGPAQVYRPGAPLDAFGVVVLDKVAEVDLTATGTRGGPVGRVGQTMVTGGAVSADGRFLALRTYTEAYVWPLAGNDVPTALQSEPLAVVALPGSPQGEAISFHGDSYDLLVGSEGVDSVLTRLTASPSLAEDGLGLIGMFQTGGDAQLLSDPDTDVVPVVGLVVVAFLGGLWLLSNPFSRRPGSGP